VQDCREAILAGVFVARNDVEISDSNLPAILILDGDEAAAEIDPTGP